MRFGSFLDLLGDQSFFDLATAVQLSDENRSKLQTQLHRWVAAGRLLPLRRGMYALAKKYRKAEINPAELAGQLYKPSYLSGLWALGFYGLIPEQVVTYTSVTTRVPRRFENAFGLFEYRHVKLGAFLGYRAVRLQGRKVLLADPEKALLDLWHLSTGPWTPERLREMRFQNHDLVDLSKLRQYADAYASPRLSRTVEVWSTLDGHDQEGTVQL